MYEIYLNELIHYKNNVQNTSLITTLYISSFAVAAPENYDVSFNYILLHNIIFFFGIQNQLLPAGLSPTG